VLIKPKMIAPTSRGNQPPSGILMRFAPQNARSMIRKNPATRAVTSGLHPHRSRATTKSSRVVITIVVVTATP
jgi:hypothetical protein